jgi:hypothetical protein
MQVSTRKTRRETFDGKAAPLITPRPSLSHAVQPQRVSCAMMRNTPPPKEPLPPLTDT